jgi:hypothetical protein
MTIRDEVSSGIIFSEMEIQTRLLDHIYTQLVLLNKKSPDGFYEQSISIGIWTLVGIEIVRIFVR